ncbi:hypothetical protein MTP03_31500 [Tsukamurella sp. PLM1]|nr:hypothetical protein MTP03_31500 [Tsukamurella sp. PLM1]
MRPALTVVSFERAGRSFIRQREVDDIVVDDVVDTSARTTHHDGVLLALHGEQRTAQRAGERDAALVRSRGIACD